MIPIILMSIIVTIIVTIIIVIVMKPLCWFEVGLGVIIGAIFSCPLVLVYFGIQIDSNIVEPAEQTVVSGTLVNINDTSYSDTHGTIRGLFYIYGSVSTDNQQAFNYYVKQADGSFKLKSAPASDSTIIYTDSTPKVESTSYVCERGKVIFEPWSIASCKEKPTTYKFYIPEGSIVEGYKLGE